MAEAKCGHTRPRALPHRAAGIADHTKDTESDARKLVELGWQDAFQDDGGWGRAPWCVPKPDDNASSTFGPGGASFTVSTPHRAMVWTRGVNPIWVTNFPFMELAYEIVGSPAGERYSVVRIGDGSTGPVTPGAGNPENPWASGSEADYGPSALGKHRVVVDVRDRFASDRVGQITLFLQSGEGPSELRMRWLGFWATNPLSTLEPVVDSRPMLHMQQDPDAVEDWQPIPLGEGTAVSAKWLCRAFGVKPCWPGPGLVAQDGVVFQLGPPERAALATSVMDTGCIPLTATWRGNQLALLLATRWYGSDQPWYTERSARPRGPIVSPNALVVELTYADGAKRAQFPLSIGDREFVVRGEPAPYLVTLHPEKHLVRITVIDNTTWSQVFLLAASVSKNPGVTVSTTPADAPAVKPRNARVDLALAHPRCARQGNKLAVENGWMRMVLDVEPGCDLLALDLVPLGRTVMNGRNPLLEVQDAQGRPLGMTLQEVRAPDSGHEAVITWSVAAGDYRVSVALDVAAQGEIRLTPTLENHTDAVWRVAMTYPRLHGCKVAAEGPAEYLLGTRFAKLDTRSIEVREFHGAAFPVPLMDVYDAESGGGIGLIIADANLVNKVFRFKHAAEPAPLTDMSVQFPNVDVPAHGRRTLPMAVLFPHAGDWHATFERYRSWARDLLSVPKRRLMDELFYCRRDYPLGGTGFLYDVNQRRYTTDRLIDESRSGFGGIDIIDVSGWAYNEQTGRVGDYLANDLGGLEELRRAVRRCHERGEKVGLYFEGYLLDRRCALAEKALPHWQLVDRNGKPKWWIGDMEFFNCPGVGPWRETLAATIAEVASKTEADAVYVDQFGFCGPDKVCWSLHHGHPVPSNPLVEERRMLQAIRSELDRKAPGTAIYIEHAPCDALMALLDGAFNVDTERRHAPWELVWPPLLRFVFPEVAVFHMVGHGIRPIPTEADELHRCLFHGLGMWLKGRSDAWFSSQFRELARMYRRIIDEHGDGFRSPDCEPLIPTLRKAVYANRFATKNKVILTVYNARYSTVAGDLVQTELPQGWTVVDLCAQTLADARRDGDKAIIRGVIGPQASGAFLLTPFSISAQ